MFEFRHLTTEDVKGALEKALRNKRKGLGAYDVDFAPEALEHIAVTAGGDLRTAYNALELAVLTTPPQSDGKIVVTLQDAEQSIQRKALSYNEDLYYDILSAFCKSLRGSDSDAALYYAMRLIEGGCDPVLVIRRLIAHSAEDVGMADPQALVIATSALTAYQNMGYPEGLIPLSEAIIYVCEAEKSYSVKNAMLAAKSDAVKTRDDNVPPYLRDNSFGSAEMKRESGNYLFPHDFGGWVEQQYLPDTLKNATYYKPTDYGFEQQVKRARARKGMKP